MTPRVVDDPTARSEAFPTVDAAQVQAGLAATAAELAPPGLAFDNCILDRAPGAEGALRTALQRKHYDIIVIGGGVRLERSLTPLFEKLVNMCRTVSPDSVLCFNTGPDTTVDAVLRWWSPAPAQ